MATRLVLNHWQDWLLTGTPNDVRLLHSNDPDHILIYPNSLGQGYIQEILLRDDLAIAIVDYTFNDNLIIDEQGTHNYFSFEFWIAGVEAGYSLCVPQFGWRKLRSARARERYFNVAILFKKTTLTTYFQAYMERLSPQAQGIVEHIIQSLYRYQGNGSISTPAGMLNQILDSTITPYSNLTFEQVIPDTLYAETVSLGYANRTPITPAMKQRIGQILSCPYQGATRRAYLVRQALELAFLRLEAMVKPRLTETDLNSIYQAASLLRQQIANPPTIEALARQVYTNRRKLNEGFHQVYGTTPFGYLRDCRLTQAKRLLTTSDLSISKVANAVGYTCHSKFTLAFRQQVGIPPKAYQMQALHCTR